VQITWKVRGAPRLLVARRAEGPVDIVRYTIVAQSRGKTVRSPIDVITVTPGVPIVLVAATSMLGTDSLVGLDSARTAVWHDLIRIGEVASESGRAMRVHHAGRERRVGPGMIASNAWKGLPLRGVWEMFSAVQPGEIPGDPNHHPPLHLSLRVSVVCGVKAVQQ
jgi:hypothetical protein